MPVRGIDEVNKKIVEHMKNQWEKTGVAWWDTVQENVFLPSQDQCPVKSGAMKSTGQNELITTPHTITCEVGYGSEATKYTLLQHENLAFHHPNGKAKFLEDPVNAAIPILARELIKRLEGEDV